MENVRSDKIFELASRFEIPIGDGETVPLSDESFKGFKVAYEEWSKKRNNALSKHLVSRPNLFRVFLPYSPRVFGLAARIIWYLDEIIIRDPISVTLNNPALKMQEAKIQITQVLQILHHFKDPIENGYILLRGTEERVMEIKEPSEFAKLLAGKGELTEALLDAAQFEYLERMGTEGENVQIYKASLDAGGIIGYHFSVPGGKTVTIPVRLNDVYPKITRDELRKLFQNVPFEQLANLYPREIERTLRATETAQSMGAAVMFDRVLDGLILEKARVQIDERHQIATAGVMDLSLPYVSGVPAERLSEIRAKMPDAFMDFRLRMLSIVQEAIRAGEIDPLSLREKVDREIIPNLRGIDGELKSTLKKAKILGYGLPIISGIGVLAGSVLSAPIVAVIGLGVGGAISGLKAVADSAEAKEKVTSNPFYFIWKAKRES